MIQLQSKYKRSIRIFNKRDAWYLETDNGQLYNMSMTEGTHTPWSDWTDKQTKGQFKELRDWQKSIFQMWAMAFTPFANITLFTVWRKGAGYNQDHDVAVCYDNTNSTWLASTLDDFWIVNTTHKNIELNKDSSYGSLLDERVRKTFYSATDSIGNVAIG